MKWTEPNKLPSLTLKRNSKFFNQGRQVVGGDDVLS